MPENPNYKVCCPRRNEGSIPRAEKFGDLITADHNVFNEGGTSAEAEICQIRWRVSQDLHYWTKLLLKDICGPGRDWHKSKRHHVQITYGLTLGQELENPLNEGKKEWAIEKPKLEHTRKVRRMYSIDPSDEEYKDIIQNARRKLKTPKAAAMLCKRVFTRACTRETVVFKNRKSQGIWSKDQIELYCWSTWIHKTKE